MGLGKLQAATTALGCISTLLPYLSYIKKLKDGIIVLAEIVVDVCIEVIGFLGSTLASLVCKFIPGIGFLLSWAFGLVIDIIIDMIFSQKKVAAIKKTYSNKAKNFSSFRQWIGGFFDSMKACY